MIVGTKGGHIAFYNVLKKYKLIQVLDMSKILGTPDQEVNSLLYLTFSAETSYLCVGGSTGSMVILDLGTMEPCYVENDFVPSEITYLHMHKAISETSKHGQILCINFDQNLFIYDIRLSKGKLSLEKVSSKCLYFDEVIDLKFLKEDTNKALLCSNSESLKLLDLEKGEAELYQGHTDIILCLDSCEKKSLFLTGSKDN